ncbi:MAG: ATP-binding protein [Bacteroidaceae bacterium]|nr:ATP-binding protein [Bacteroidaceae bacterium]
MQNEFMFDNTVRNEKNVKEAIPSNYKEMTILQLMESITEKAAHSRLSDCFFAKVRPLSTLLGEKLGLTPEQAVLYSIFIDNYNDSQIQLVDIQRQTGARMVRIAQLQDDIDAIEKKRYIRRSECYGRGSNSTAYHVPHDSLTALRGDKAYVPKKVQNLSFRIFTRELDNRVKQRYDLNEPFELFVEDISELINSNMHLKIASQLAELKDNLSIYEWTLLVVMCTCELFHGKRFSLVDLNKIFDELDFEVMLNNIEGEFSTLQNEDLIEYGFSDGVVDKNCLSLTRKAKQKLLSENKQKSDGGASNLREASKISVKQLFYDEEVQTQVNRLCDLLGKKKFGEICKRMKASGMRQGFACLFYGTPGTGKTETVLQLAKKTGRNIMQVDFSEIKDKYVGESEKNVKAIFDNYREAAKTEKLCPILLFNEADAIIGKRLEKVEHSVDNMYNSMQNIILQEMENFEGILIATTNLEGNMDSAFERRFLYKVRFEKPTPKVRQQIWQSIVPSLTDEIAMRLANEHEFSGGQIENIARKQIVDNILYGESEDIYASLKEYCNSESIQNRKARPSIGFL